LLSIFNWRPESPTRGMISVSASSKDAGNAAQALAPRMRIAGAIQIIGIPSATKSKEEQGRGVTSADTTDDRASAGAARGGKQRSALGMSIHAKARQQTVLNGAVGALQEAGDKTKKEGKHMNQIPNLGDSIKLVIAEACQRPPQLVSSRTLLEELNIDSLTFVSLLAQIEAACEMEFTIDALFLMMEQKTVGDLVTCIESCASAITCDPEVDTLES
jgi:acyl carrier protein